MKTSDGNKENNEHRRKKWQSEAVTARGATMEQEADEKSAW